MTDNVERRLRFTQILEEIAALFGPFIEEPDLGPIRRGVRVAGPLPDPWLRRMALGRTVGKMLTQAAQLKVAAMLAGNEDLVVASDRRISTILFDDELCPRYEILIKLPKGPIPPDPGPRPDELALNWNDFESLVSTMVNYHASLQDGALKDEISGIVKQVAGPG